MHRLECVDRVRLLAGGKAFNLKVFLEDNVSKLRTNIAFRGLDEKDEKLP